MAGMVQPHFLAKGSCTSFGSITSSEPKIQNKRISHLRKQTITYEGLRFQNVVDSLLMKSYPKATLGKIKRVNQCTSVTKPRRQIVARCGKGLSIIFVGAEVCPWSKTGGLGDVLGGLPLAMAVNFIL